METTIKNKIHQLESLITNPSKGLPEELFLFTSRITPLVNVDLLIKNEKNQTLLTWRDDEFFEPGWHVPGGIVRFKETLFDRINAVANNELGISIKFEKEPLAINEVINPTRKTRGHFISFLYNCTLAKPLIDKFKFDRVNPAPGQWMWHDKCPDNLIPVHGMYKKYI